MSRAASASARDGPRRRLGRCVATELPCAHAAGEMIAEGSVDRADAVDRFTEGACDPHARAFRWRASAAGASAKPERCGEHLAERFYLCPQPLGLPHVVCARRRRAASAQVCEPLAVLGAGAGVENVA